MGHAPVGKLIAKFAVPSIISFLVNAAYNITDQIFIGQIVGMYGNAATNVAFPVTTFTNAAASLIGAGTAASFNLLMGAKKPDEAEKISGTGLASAAVFSVFFTALIYFFQSEILIFCGATEQVFPYAKTYLSLTLYGMPFFLFTQAVSPLIRADGSPSYSMFCTAFGAVLNGFLDWIFMYRFGWGIEGAAVATSAGQIVSFLLCVFYFPRFKNFRIRFSSLRIRIDCLIRIVKLGTSNFINHTVMMFVNIVMNKQLAGFGALTIYGSDMPLAVSGVISKLSSILTAFTVGMAHGCQPILGYNMGAKNYDRVKSTFRKAITAAFVLSIAAFLAFQLFPRRIVSIFGSGDEVYYQFAERYLRIYMMLVCVYGVQPIAVNYFSGTGSVRQGIFLSLSRQGFFLIPLLYMLPVFFGIDGVLYAGPASDAMAFVLSLVMVKRSFRRLDILKQQEMSI